MSGFFARFPVAWRPVVALPIDQVRRWLLGETFPQNIAVVGQCDVGEDGVLLMRLSLSPFSLSRRSKKGWRNLQVDHGKLSVL